MANNSNRMSYEWMVKHTPQEEWIQGKGMLLWLAFFFSEIGAGIYFVSIFLNFHSGWLVGWLTTLVLGGLVHVSYLGKPMRSWRILLRPGNSELSRGLWVILLFAVIGFFQVLPVVVSSLPWTGDSAGLKTIMAILCILIMAHGFMTMGVVKALPFWNSSMMIPMSLVSGIWVGSQASELLLLFLARNIDIAEVWARWSLLSYIGVLAMFVWGATHASEAARVSMNKLLLGDSSVHLYIWGITVGIVIPLIITIVAWTNDVANLSGGILLVRFLCVLVGDLVIRHKIMEGGLYSPLI
jgi:formate-dependent nitrite reductase membrane component NrfD